MIPAGAPRAGRRSSRCVAAILVWNLIFDLWLGQAERQYLWKKAAHALGEARDVTLDGSIAVAVREGAWVATAWTAVVVASILLAAWLGYRAGRRVGAGRRPRGRRGGLVRERRCSRRLSDVHRQDASQEVLHEPVLHAQPRMSSRRPPARWSLPLLIGARDLPGRPVSGSSSAWRSACPSG